MRKTILTYGLISGLITAVLMVASSIYYKKTSSFEFGEVIGYTSIFLSMLFVFLGVKAFRDKLQDGSITFGKAFQVGIMITIISCLIYVITWLILYETLMSDFMEKYASEMLSKMQASGATAEKIAEETEKMEYYKEMYKNPLYRFLFTFIEPFPVGLLVTLISAAVLRTKTSEA
ncbi:MAG: DUF4199 domain-containing protein [Saprospiraceae bacterium]